MATKRILLTRDWSGHKAGEIVEEWDKTVESMVRKGYGEIVTAKDLREKERAEAKAKADAEREARERAEAEKAEKGKGPQVETADAPPAAENAAVTPRTGKAGK